VKTSNVTDWQVVFTFGRAGNSLPLLRGAGRASRELARPLEIEAFGSSPQPSPLSTGEREKSSEALAHYALRITHYATFLHINPIAHPAIYDLPNHLDIVEIRRKSQIDRAGFLQLFQLRLIQPQIEAGDVVLELIDLA